MSSKEDERKEDEDLEEGTQKVSLKDVLKQSPAESKAETSVLRSIEGQGSERASLSAGILEGVPEDASHVFQSTNAGGDQPPSSSPSPPTPPSNEPESVEEELFNMANEMKGHSGQEDASKEKKTKEDAFANNADHLMGQARKSATNWKTKKGAHETYAEFKSFLAFRKNSLWSYSKHTLILIGVAIGIACLLFYALGNPGGDTPEKATGSWWILFVFVRQPLTLTLAKALELIVIDFFCLRRPIVLKIIGPFLTLLLVQSKGWPFQLCFWGLIDFAMLYGKGKFARHWLFYLPIDIFNDSNQAGTVLEATVYMNLLILVICVGVAVALKRFWMGLLYGKGIYRRYGKELSAVMKKSVLIGKLAQFAKNTGNVQHRSLEVDYAAMTKSISGEEDEAGNVDDGLEDSSHLLIDTRRRNVYSGTLAFSQEIKIRDLLGEWEDPTIDERVVEDASISAIVQFRTAASCIDGDYPFSYAFGLADKRENCIDSSQKLYLKLKPSDSPVLKFDEIAILAMQRDGTLDEQKVKDLINIFRPTRDGGLTMLDFVKSIDTVYKDLRLIRASILNVQKMNAASQRLWDVVFYFIIIWISLGVIGIDPVALVGSLLAIIVGLSFMVGNALSKAFEGLLLVLVRKPYDVGDRIAMANCNEEASGTGSSGWIVKDVDLYNTTLVYGTTGEEATMTNGYLNQYRIINMNRSPKAVLNFVMKFGIEVSKEKIDAFGKAVENYVKDRPREWLSFSAYRLTNVAADCGYVEYKVILQHRESWQQIGALLNSKSDVQKFAFELSKELGMDYESPPMPIIVQKREDSGDDEETDALASALSMMD